MPAPPREDPAELAALRAAMDVCNQRLAAVLHERAALARRIGTWKAARGLPAADPAREAAMLRAVRGLSANAGFDADALERIFAAVFAESRALAARP
jgi:chorismate mutase